MLTIARAVFRWWWGAVTSAGDTLLVWAGWKYWPATGRAQWIRLSTPDLRAGAWMTAVRTCPHQDSEGVSWVIPMTVRHQGEARPARVCSQCHAYRVVLSHRAGIRVMSEWFQGDSR